MGSQFKLLRKSHPFDKTIFHCMTSWITKMTYLDPERLSIKKAVDWENYPHCENCELPHYLFQFYSAFPFSGTNSQNLPFLFNVKISSHQCNPSQRSLQLCMLIKNPHSHFLAVERSCTGETAPPLYSYMQMRCHICSADPVALRGCVL